MSLKKVTACAAIVAAAGLAQGQVTNGGFETSQVPPPGFTGWMNFGFNFVDNISRDTATFRTGVASCKIFGQFNGLFQNDTGIFQDTSLSLTEGDLIRGTVYCRHNAADPIGDQNGISNVGFFTMFLKNAGGTVSHSIGGATLTEASPTDQWIEFTVEGVVPAGATIASFTAGYVQFEFNGGSIYFDDFSIQSLGPAPSGLLNASFEQADDIAGNRPAFWDVIPGINEFNATVNADVSLDGTKSLLMFGLFGDADTTTVVWQDLPATAGELFQADVSALHGSGDPLMSNSVGTPNATFLNLEFRDAGDNLLTITSIPLVDANSPTDVWVPGMVSATAPANAASARLNLGFFQPDEPTGPAGDEPAGAAFFDDANIMSLGANDGLINPGFETFVPDASFQPDANAPFPGWSNAGFTGTNLQHALEDPRTGQYSARMFGQFSGPSTTNDTVIFQEFDVTPGDEVEFSGYANHLGVDPLTGDNSAFLAVVWLNGSGGIISDSAVTVLTAASPTDTDILGTVTASAPGGTAKAQVVVGFQQQDDAPGAALWDDMSVVITPGTAPCPGDSNGDGSVNFDDLNEVLAFWNTMQPVGTNGDVTDDGMVNFDDLNLILANWNTTCF